MTTPAITLEAMLQDVSGNALGSAANPAQLRIALCGYGNQLPRIAGTALIAAVGPLYLQVVGGSITAMLWGNDAITPAGTYYDIALLDTSGNVVQSGLYQLTGSGTFQLSSLTPLNPPPPAIPAPFALDQVMSGAGTQITLAPSPMPGATMLVFRDGIVMSVAAGDITVNGAVVTFTQGYESSAVIKVIWYALVT
jgi:hypothetical protein